jgi:diguanylate cyclase (GGDEF)-like protein
VADNLLRAPKIGPPVSITRYFPKQYFFPIVLILGSSFGCLFYMFSYLTGVQDQMEVAREEQFVRNSVRTATNLAVHDLQDYTIWDDAVRNVASGLDPAWVDQNVSAYLGKIQGYEHVFVVDGTGRTLYSFNHGARSPEPRDAGATLGAGFLTTLGRVMEMPAEAPPVTAGFSRNAQGQPYLFGVGRIIPLSGTVPTPSPPGFAIVVAGALTPQRLDNWTEMYQGSALSIVADGKSDARLGTLDLKDDDGRQVARLAWSLSKPGTDLMRKILPGFIVIGLISLLSAGLILQRARLNNEALHRSKVRAQYLAHHDILTGLPNRRELLSHLRGSIRRTRVYLLYMDLDGFKETNDVYGHAAGDDVLREAAARITLASGPNGIIVRAGGDEVAVLLTGVDGAVAEDTAEAVLRAFDKPFHVSGYSVTVGVSIGISSNEDTTDEEELIRRADLAMYASKSNGKNSWCHYDRELDRDNESRRELEGPLRAAVAEDRIGVVFQPIVDADSGRIVKVEALARWTDPVLGSIPPDRFIRVAEQSGLINDLGRNVLRRACRATRDWEVGLAVNLSPAQFWDRDLARTIHEIVESERFPAARLELEITESYLLRRADDAERILQRLRARGMRIALDDFGCGFASIGYLQRLSFDAIKIDRSFVDCVDERADAANLARAIVSLGLALNLTVTAEGVETAEQAHIMAELGCTELQGWLYGRPMTEEQMAAALTDQEQHGVLVG